MILEIKAKTDTRKIFVSDIKWYQGFSDIS